MKRQRVMSFGPGRQRAWDRRYGRRGTGGGDSDQPEPAERQPLIAMIPPDVLELVAGQKVYRTAVTSGNVGGTVADHDPPISLAEACDLLELPNGAPSNLRHILFDGGARIYLTANRFIRCRLADGHLYVPLAERERRGTPRHYLTMWNVGRWADILARGVSMFGMANGFSPNIMLASRELYDRIDRVVRLDRDHVEDDTGRHPSPDEPVDLGEFWVRDARITFAVDESIVAPHYALVYDGNAEFVSEEETNGDANDTAT